MQRLSLFHVLRRGRIGHTNRLKVLQHVTCLCSEDAVDLWWRFYR